MLRPKTTGDQMHYLYPTLGGKTHNETSARPATSWLFWKSSCAGCFFLGGWKVAEKRRRNPILHLSDELDNTTSFPNLLLSQPGDESGLDDEGLGDTTLAELQGEGGKAEMINQTAMVEWSRRDHLPACACRAGRGR